MKSVAPLHGDDKAPPIFSSPSQRFQWDTKCALTISVDDEFPGTLDAMVVSKAEAVTTQTRPPSSSKAVAVPVVANVFPGPLRLPPARTSCNQLQNEWELQLLQVGSQSARGLPKPPPSQPPPVAQPLVSVVEGSPLPEGPSLAVLPPTDPLCQPRRATQPLVAVEQGPPLEEAPHSHCSPTRGPTVPATTLDVISQPAAPRCSQF